MSGAMFLLVAMAGGVGACARFWLDRGVQRALCAWGDPAGARLGILVVNVTGCFLAGLGAVHMGGLVGWSARRYRLRWIGVCARSANIWADR